VRETVPSHRDRRGKVPAQTTWSAEPFRRFLAACRCFPASVAGTSPVCGAAAGGSSQRAAPEREAAAVGGWEPRAESEEFSLDLPMGMREVPQNALESAVFRCVLAKD